MEKFPESEQAISGKGPASAFAPRKPGRKSPGPLLLSAVWLPLVLALAAFLVYVPSLQSDFVYDARVEILQEGFITSLSNFPAVLSFKVLGMSLMLGDRPGQILYLMLIAAVCGQDPWGYHLCSNLLHAANVALLFILLRRLTATEAARANRAGAWKLQLAISAATLIFALHPIVTETVAAVNYSSDLLVTFFTLAALLAATAFRPENARVALVAGAGGVFGAFAAVTSKESGMTAALLLVVYWFLYRRPESKRPWLLFLGAALAVTAAFLAARFLVAPPPPKPLSYLGGSFAHVFWIQPRLWVFMMGKLVWPTGLSADYTPENWSGLSTPSALAILAVVVAWQTGLAWKSRLGALGMAVYWLGLATVSNFMPLNRVLADRFYYLPLAGGAMELLALLQMALKTRLGLWPAAPILAALAPLALLTLIREGVFVSESALWSGTLQASPRSGTAHNGLGLTLFEKGRVDEAMAHYQEALKISSEFERAHNNLGVVFLKKGRLDEATAEFQRALKINPHLAEAHNNLGVALLRRERVDEAMEQFRTALKTMPNFADAYVNLGMALLRKGRMEDAMVQYQKAIDIDPDFSYADVHYDLGVALFQKGLVDAAIVQYRKAAEISPADAEIRNNLGVALLQKGRPAEGMAQFQKAVEIDPANAEAQENVGNVLLQAGRFSEAAACYRKAVKLAPSDAEAHHNLGLALSKMGRFNDAVAEFQEVLRLKPGDAEAQARLAEARTAASQAPVSK